MKKSKILKLCQNIGLDEPYLEKILWVRFDFYFTRTAKKSVLRLSAQFSRCQHYPSIKLLLIITKTINQTTVYINEMNTHSQTAWGVIWSIPSPSEYFWDFCFLSIFHRFRRSQNLVKLPRKNRTLIHGLVLYHANPEKNVTLITSWLRPLCKINMMEIGRPPSSGFRLVLWDGRS